MRSSERRSAGFTLLEVLIALVVFTTVMGGLLTAVSQAVRALGSAEREVEIMQLAQDQIREIQLEAETGSPPPLGESGGSFPEPYDHMRWEIRVDYFPYPLPELMTAAQVQNARERSAMFAHGPEQPTSLRLVVLRVYDEFGVEFLDPFTILAADSEAPQ
jgi:prepilin-type N-terminal cleavage/methylation domain-containing protein